MFWYSPDPIRYQIDNFYLLPKSKFVSHARSNPYGRRRGQRRQHYSWR